MMFSFRAGRRVKPDAYADRALIEHMLECVARIREYTRGGRDTFLHSGLIQDAVIRNLPTLAESSQRLSDGAKNDEPAVPWKNMAGMRNILVHDYLGGVDIDTVGRWWIAAFQSLNRH